MTNAKTRRTVTLPNGKTVGRKFPAGKDAFAVVCDKGLVGWSGTLAGANRHMAKAGLMPLSAWAPCDCGNWWCQVHNQHAHDCPCPPAEEMAHDPYSEHLMSPPKDTPKRPRGRPPVDDKRTRRVGMNDTEWKRVQEMARADGYTSASKWVRVKIGAEPGE